MPPTRRSPEEPTVGDGSRPGRQAPPDFLEAVVAAHGRQLRSLAERLTGGGPDAEDLVQETLLRAWRHPAALAGPPGTARAWLFTVARNLAIDRWRRIGSRGMTAGPVPWAGEVPTAHDAVDDPVGLADRIVDEAVVSLALQGLSHEHREVLLHAVWLDQSVAQISSNLGIAPGTAKSRLHYALRALRRALDELGYLP